jgi:hypothetical protein
MVVAIVPHPMACRVLRDTSGEPQDQIGLTEKQSWPLPCEKDLLERELLITTGCEEVTPF